MQLVDNTYQVADGYFISNYIGSSAFAAENLIFPPLAVIAGVGLMFGSGGAALIACSLGEGDNEKANRQMSLIVGILTLLGIMLAFLLFMFMPVIARAVGVPDELSPLCVEYGRILAICIPFLVLNGAFHSLLITADRPGLGMAVSVLNAAVNILLDWLAVAVFGMGLKGAAMATGLAWIISSTIPIGYFFNRKNPLHFTSFRWNGSELAHTCYNGSSEMMSVLSYSIIAILFNTQLLKYAGEYGVDAYAVCVYVNGVFAAVFTGIGMSMNPVVGYHKGQQNTGEIRSIRKNGMFVVGALGLAMTAVCYLLSYRIAGFFVGYNPELVVLSMEALQIICFSYLFGGINTFSSAFFTGMGDGGKSLAIAAGRSFVVPLAGVIMLSVLFGRTGIWMVTPIAEVFTLGLVLFFFVRYRKKGIL